jgi:hypothetical protein
MPRNVLIDELHLSLYIAPGLPPEDTNTIRAILFGRRFSADLRQAVKVVIRRYPALRAVRFRLTR